MDARCFGNKTGLRRLSFVREDKSPSLINFGIYLTPSLIPSAPPSNSPSIYNDDDDDDDDKDVNDDNDVNDDHDDDDAGNTAPLSDDVFEAASSTTKNDAVDAAYRFYTSRGKINDHANEFEQQQRQHRGSVPLIRTKGEGKEGEIRRDND